MLPDRNFAGDETKPDYSGWGLIAKKEYADYFNIHDGNSIINGISIPASKTICTVIDAGEKGNINKALFEPFYSYTKQNATETESTIYASLLTRTHDSTGSYHRYLYTFCQT